MLICLIFEFLIEGREPQSQSIGFIKKLLIKYEPPVKHCPAGGRTLFVGVFARLVNMADATISLRTREKQYIHLRWPLSPVVNGSVGSLCDDMFKVCGGVVVVEISSYVESITLGMRMKLPDDMFNAKRAT